MVSLIGISSGHGRMLPSLIFNFFIDSGFLIRLFYGLTIF